MKLLAVTLFAVLSFRIASAPYTFVFPRDHGAHPAYQSEWWYFTGHLRAHDGHRFGFELTIFRFGIRPGDAHFAPSASRWHGSEVFPAHFAITDVDDKTFVHDERFVRDALGMGAASTTTLNVHAGNWSIRGIDPIRLHAASGANAIDLALQPDKPPAINGEGGISRKGTCSSCASHYYSLTRLATVGTLVVGGTHYTVDGESWMDHEFGSDELQANQRGWDWYALQLDDGRELMLYVLRQEDGGVTPQSSGSLVARDGRVRHLVLRDFQTQALGVWKSPASGALYPSGWHVRVPSEGLDVTISPLLRDQELIDQQLHVAYWEGDCDLSGTDRSRPVRGAAYVELTGYAGILSF
ncbi:MAG TPA: lipocalin-like domain-containing protein [Candidatus Baltobacteraceae bacterium]|jgi:predicted secreted hydrolase